VLVSGGVESAPDIEGVVDLEPVQQVLPVVRIADAVAAGDGFEAARERVRVDVRCDVGGMDDPRGRRRPGSFRSYLPMMDSKEQRPSWWPSSTPGASKGTAPVSCATRSISLFGTNRNSASLSTKRLISHGRATRSTWTCERVTQCVVYSYHPSRRGTDGGRHSREVPAPVAGQQHVELTPGRSDDCARS
jgi:hypothetical protein